MRWIHAAMQKKRVAAGALLEINFRQKIFHADRIKAWWKLDAYPRLAVRHLSLNAAILYRDCRQRTDDLAVWVRKVAA